MNKDNKLKGSMIFAYNDASVHGYKYKQGGYMDHFAPAGSGGEESDLPEYGKGKNVKKIIAIVAIALLATAVIAYGIYCLLNDYTTHAIYILSA